MIDYKYLTEIEKKEVHFLFKGWDEKYLKSLLFEKRDNGWVGRDEDLRASCLMKRRVND